MSQPDVVVVVGTDHHPFDRVVRWVDAWASSRGRSAFVQYGSSEPPTTVDGADLLPRDELVDLLRGAAAVVTHGGPATIADARANGHLPIVCPREPERGEHVDEHQVLFTARLATRGEVRLARTKRELQDALDEAMADPEGFRVPPEDVRARVRDAVQRFAEECDLAVRSSRRRRRRRLLDRGVR